MDIIEYQEEAKRTLNDLGSIRKNMRHMDVGVFTEFGEILDIFKRVFAYGAELDEQHLKEEIGDVLWYIVNGFTISNVGTIPIPKPSRGGDRNYFINVMTPLDLHQGFLQNGFSFALSILSTMCNAFEFNIEEIMQMNIDKLKVRYPEKFDADKAINRNTTEEYEVIYETE